MTGRRTPRYLSTTAVAIMLLLATVHGLSRFSEPDLWWHLRVGDWIRQGHGLVWPDPSAAFADRDYVATQWLPEVVASWLYSVVGLGGILWLRAVAVLAITGVVYAACRRFAGRLPAALVAGLALLGEAAGLNPRPQLLSFLFFALVVLAWCGTARDLRPRWWLVPLFWVWACCHGLWVFGLAVGAVVLLLVTVDPRRRRDGVAVRNFYVLWAGCLAAVALTPLGPRLLLTPFDVATNASMIAEEWRATPFNNVFSVTAVAMIVACAVLWATRPEPRPWWQIGMLAFAAATTLWMWRLVPIGTITAAPMLAGALQDRLSADREPVTRRERLSLLSGCLVLAVSAAALSAGQLGASASRYPSGMTTINRALDFLPPSTVVLDDFGISGWLLWAHPDLSPVADLRGEIYDHEYLSQYKDALAVKPGWRDFVDRTGAKVALVERDSALADALRTRSHWAVVASNAEFVLLRQGARP
jgi:hypothetical protein